MFLRRPASVLTCLALLSTCIVLAGCSSLHSLTISPGAGSVVLTAVGQTAQFTALGVSQMGNGTPTSSNITSSVTWSSSNPSVATISSTGLATAVGSGITQITAESDGIIATSDVAVTLASGSSSAGGSGSITVTPNTGTDTFIGETTQFLATGSLTGGTAQNLTNQVQWMSSNAQVATINASGLATAVGAGTTTITAYSGGLTASATLNVVISANVGNSTLAIIPTSATATFAGETTQFIAIGNLSGGGATTNLTNKVAWSSSDISVATIDQSGLATAQAINKQTNTTTITAIGTTSTGSVITATATLTSIASTTSVNLPSLAVYMTGTGTGIVTSSPGNLACGSSAVGASCTNSFSSGTTVTLTASPSSGSSFAGWSSNCAGVSSGPKDPTSGQPLSCTVTMNNNITVGAIFN